MTGTTTPPVELVVAGPGTRLEQLHAAYAEAKAAADESAKRLKAITDAIKVELTQAAPEGSTRIALSGQAGPALRLTYTERVTFDSQRFKAEHPETWMTYAKKGHSWTLKAAGGEDQ